MFPKSLKDLRNVLMRFLRFRGIDEYSIKVDEYKFVEKICKKT